MFVDRKGEKKFLVATSLRPPFASSDVASSAAFFEMWLSFRWYLSSDFGLLSSRLSVCLFVLPRFLSLGQF
jgi:hypothetical protein